MSISKLRFSSLCQTAATFTKRTAKPFVGARPFSQTTSHPYRLQGRSFVAGAALGSAITGAASYALFNNYNDSNRVQRYLDLLKQYPETLGPIGNANEGEIEIVKDPATIAQIEKQTGQKAGILAENKWQIWICDPVKFPNGTYGIYGRFLWKQALSGPSGVAVLPILPNGKILLIRIYRHALRKWVLEIPRGNGEGRELIQQIAKRELKEETGAEMGDITMLGKINADSGITSGGISIVRAEIARFGNPDREPAEQSISLHAFSREELDKAMRQGHAEIKVNGKMQKVEIGTDSFTLAALELDRLFHTKV